MAIGRSAIRHPPSAMTLVELLVAMSVVAILMLGGVGVYWRMNRGFALQAATSSIETVLRAARHAAIHERGPAVVVAEPRADEPKQIGLLYALSRQTVSHWHFESPSQFAGSKVLGALGQEATATGSPTPAPGRIGTALLLDGATTSLQVTSPYLDGLREGVFIEAYVWPDAAGLSSGAILPIACKDARAASSYRLELVYDGDNTFSLQGAVRVDLGGSAHELTVASREVPIPAGEWTHVGLAYARDGKDSAGDSQARFLLRVNSEEAEPPRPPDVGNTLLLVPNTQPLTIGSDGANHFKGRIDELKIAGLVAGEVHRIPSNTEVAFDPGGSRDGRVHFDREGKLDPAQHTGPVFFRVVSAEDRLLRTVRITWLGSVEVFNGEPPAD
ncbi:MAG TPA: prepilin-type N-terminal cleavage/methylation domain-containing protein [Planctomycetota bacterium]|nr:prepilin-type N-terminal cleavage/methylation domain-containing protein [Planctomycetota bacterium]HRR79646.1 prepilin-type N-terminal cleavage/methylation domain-containing protein [Planctomycetota bacterium]HRT97480.1 prepilin-type N-terminal cleavage/methylation domain-containing protein [Planctomycetota bacterium]